MAGGGREDLETLLQQTQQTGTDAEDMFERDFIHKRTVLMSDQLRKLSHECFLVCRDPLVGGQERVLAQDSVFTRDELTCIEKCEARVERLKDVVERHVNDTFSPNFFTKYMMGA